jgi:biotin synthase
MPATLDDIIDLLESEGEAKKQLFREAAEVSNKHIDDKVYLRGLIEFSNYCSKNCLYCGIRRENKNVERYNLEDEQIMEAARYAYENRYGSIVLQSGELQSRAFTRRISGLLRKIRKMTGDRLWVTLSCGEQSYETYEDWHWNGASRYLLRIETTDRELYYRIYPEDTRHSYENRVNCLYALKDIGYQVGTGVMIGLPFQTTRHLAKDLLWMKNFNVDMVGMGPYIEHHDTPLADHKDLLLPLEKRFELSLKMIAILRIMMPDINIAAATALQAIDKVGREKGILAGANVMMPNITPGQYRDAYKLYENKPCTTESAEDCGQCMELRIALTKHDIAWEEPGDSRHYSQRNKPLTVTVV